MGELVLGVEVDEDDEEDADDEGDKEAELDEEDNGGAAGGREIHEDDNEVPAEAAVMVAVGFLALESNFKRSRDFF